MKKNDAQRVIVVGKDGLEIAETIKESLKDLKIETKQSDKIQIIEVPKIITEYKEIEKIIPVIEYKVIEIEKLVIVKEIQIIEIEKPIIINQSQVLEVPVIVKQLESFPKVIMYLLLGQLIINLISIFFHK